jgi:hypothetical protein
MDCNSVQWLYTAEVAAIPRFLDGWCPGGVSPEFRKLHSQPSVNRLVAGSNPARGANDFKHLMEIRRVVAARDQSGWPRRSRLGTFRHLGNPAYAATASGTVQFSRVVQSVGDALELCAGLTRFGRRGEAAWCGQEDTGGTRAAFRTGRRQFAFRHRSHLCERPALLAHIFVCRHRPPAPGLSASCGGPVRRNGGKLYQLTAGL